MILYFLLLLLVLLFVRMACVNSGLSKVSLIMAFACLVAMAGLRSRVVGTDSIPYVGFFERTSSWSDIGESQIEPAYLLLNWGLRQFTDQYAYLFLTIATIVVGCFMYVVLTHTARSQWTVAFFVFIAAGVYTFCFNGARQGISIAIYSLAVGSLIERRIAKYTLIVILAALFHNAALIALPCYFLLRPGSTWREYLMITAIGTLAVFFFGQIAGLGVNWIEGSNSTLRYVSYFDSSSSTAGRLLTAFTTIQCLFFIYFRRFVTLRRDQYSVFVCMYYLAAVIRFVSSVLGLDPNGLARFAETFAFSSIFLYPIVFENVTSLPAKQLFTLGFAVVYLIFFGLSLNTFGNLIPYQFNPALLEFF